jgi:hypothetical protein
VLSDLLQEEMEKMSKDKINEKDKIVLICCIRLIVLMLQIFFNLSCNKMLKAPERTKQQMKMANMRMK